ncbi:unnamed protein product [Ilex paraguariensis]|uniref:Tetraspanin-8 n=1 Tax=Ilex paraguariensis TaxID=185542 RepID=A0ABC8QQR8_9AQUA
MVRVSNGLITFLNLVSLIISVAAIGYSLWLYTHNGTLCQKVIQKPLLILGVSLLFMSLLGLIGSCCRVSFLLWIYLFVMFVLIVGLFCFTLFTIIVTNKGVGKAISGRGYKEYRLGDYSRWLQKYVVNGNNWDEIKSCLVDLHFCHKLAGEKAEEFYKHSLSPTESGCCKPPSYCGFQFENATFWTVPKSGPAVPDSDCTMWSNNQTELCFDCKSCKAGVLANMRREWRQLAIINFIIIIIIICIYSVACCALRNNRADGYQRHKGGYP